MDRSELAILIGKMKPKGMGEEASKESEEPEVGEEDVYEDGLVTTAREIREALAAEDDEAFAAALRDFVVQCDSMPHKEGEHEEEED